MESNLARPDQRLHFHAFCFNCKAITLLGLEDYANYSTTRSFIVEGHRKRRRGHRILVTNKKNIDAFPESQTFKIVTEEFFISKHPNV